MQREQQYVTLFNDLRKFNISVKAWYQRVCRQFPKNAYCVPDLNLM